MSYKIKRKTLCNRFLVGSAFVAASFGVFSCSDKYNLDSDEEQPSNLNSIYGYLEGQGNFTQYLQLINDLGEADVLQQTGSNTMFAANDDAFNTFFQEDPLKWGAKSVSELTEAQKKLLLYSSMVDNPYSTSMLSTADGPIKGEVFRRSSSVTIYDSVLVVPNDDPMGILPQTSRFDELKASTTRTSTVLFDDQSQPNPMIHFNAQFMTSNKILSSDVDFIYGKWMGYGTRSEEDVYVNNAKIVEPNIFCKNGFVHRVDRVLLPLDNMSESIRKTSNTSLYSSIIERFAAVAYDKNLTDAYNNSKGTSYDSVFIKRYYSDRSYGSTANGTAADKKFDSDKNGLSFEGSLLFDPGWNGMYPQMTAKGTDPMMEDMMVMLVPTNAALTDWWNGEGGSDIHNFYAPGITDTKEGLSKVPVSVLDDLVNAGMKSPFTTTIPSNFSNILDDANMKLGITESDIDSVILSSNGLIYVTNKVFAPTAYSSVLSPAVIDTVSFSAIANAIENLDYQAYLNSMVSEYTFLLPTNNAMQSFVDPVSYYASRPQMWKFAIDGSKTVANRLSVSIFNCSIDETGVVTPDASSVKTLSGTSNQYIKDRLEEILDNLIITQKYTPGKKFYKTKGNTFVRVEPSSVIDGFDVSATYQSQVDNPIKVLTDSIYTKKNGYTYVVDQVPMGGRKSVAMMLNDKSDFSDFLWALVNSGALSKVNSKDSWIAGDQTYGNLLNIKAKGMIGSEDATSSTKVTYLLNNFHYTIYAPTNDAMQQAFSDGLPDATDLAEAEALDAAEGKDGTIESHADSIREVLLDFVKYHIQDNSLFVDEGFSSGEYESGKTELIPSTNIVEASSSVTIESVDNTHIAVTTGETTVIYETPDQSDPSKNVLTYSGSTIILAQYYNGYYSPGRPYKLNVNVSSSGMTVTDVMGNTRNISTTDGMYNIMAREYWSGGTKATAQPYTVELNNSSFAVIHAIDGPLYFDSPKQFKYEYKKLYKETSAKRRK